jgi:hypothetical protein
MATTPTVLAAVQPLRDSVAFLTVATSMSTYEATLYR